MRITIILPFPVTKPVGGAKIMYEYANRLAAQGHTVSVYHSIKRPFKKTKTPLWFKQAVFALRGVARPKWFPLNPQIKSVIVPSIIDKYIPDADIIFSTWWQMTYAINELSDMKGKKFNLIQDFEIWKGMEDEVKRSYTLPVNHIVIAKYLQKMVAQISEKEPIYIPNAIDEKKYFRSILPEKRDPHSLIMLYSKEPRKGTLSGIEALKKVKLDYPLLNAVFFGVYDPPENLPEWITYQKKPADLVSLYNKAAIFFSPSLGEGWALPPAEAMACGCAVVCTEIGGHIDYAINGQTALLATPNDIEDMSEKIKNLIGNQELRCRLANNAALQIHKEFNWKNSSEKLENCFFNSLKK